MKHLSSFFSGAYLLVAGRTAGAWTGQASLPAAIGFVLGLFGIGLGYPGQPHVVNRFMAIRDDRAIVHGRRVAVTWAVIRVRRAYDAMLKGTPRKISALR